MLKPKKQNTYIYARVSGNQKRINNDDPNSLFVSTEYQTQTCLSYSSRLLKVNNPSIIVENKPSFCTEMSQQVNLFELLKDNNIHIIFMRVDRFSRCFSKALEIIDKIISSKNITLHFVEENILFNKNSSSGVKQLLIEALMKAHVESDNLSRRQKDINTHLKNKGHELGPAPYGMKIIFENGIRKKVLDENENQMIDFIKKIFSPILYNDNNPISFRLLNLMLINLTNDKKIKKKIKDDPIQIWDTKVKKEEQNLSKGFDAEDIAFILNDKGFLKRGKEWTTGSINNIVHNSKNKRKAHIMEKTIDVNNDLYIDKLKNKKSRFKYNFNGNFGHSQNLIQKEITENINKFTL